MDRIVEKLERIGLTDYEAKAYVALLEVDLNTKMQEIAKERFCCCNRFHDASKDA